MALSPRAARRALAGAVMLIAGYYAVWGGEYSAFDLRQMRLDLLARRDTLRETRREIVGLRGRVRALEHDDSAVERVAREQFGMVARGEILYRFVEPDSTPGAARERAAQP